MTWKFWKKTKKVKPSVTKTETNSVTQEYKATNSSISTGAGYGGIDHIEISTPNPDKTLELWKDVIDKLTEKKSKQDYIK